MKGTRRDTGAKNIKRDIEIYELKAEIAKLRRDINELKIIKVESIVIPERIRKIKEFVIMRHK